jgi:lipopolysaccharide export system protein LptA
MSLVTWLLLAGVALLAGCKKPGSLAVDTAPPPNASGDATNFTIVAYYNTPPNPTQAKTRLTGADAQPLPGGLLLIKRLKLETFSTNGTLQAVIEAPECIYDTTHNTANSAGHLRLQSGDGKIRTDGDGFLWRQDDSFLTISNNVKTWIASMAIAAAGATNAVAQTNWEAQLGSDRTPTIITAHIGEFTQRRAIYSGDVHVDNPQMKLTCEWLAADLPQSGQINHIVAETNVVIDFFGDKGQRWHAGGDKAVYNYSVQNGVTNKIITLTGNAAVTNFTGTNVNFAFTGEPIYLNLLKKTVHAENYRSIINPDAQTAGTNVVRAPLPPGADTNFPPGKLDLVPSGHPGGIEPRPPPH